MKKVLLLIAILLISGCDSLFSSVFVDQQQKEKEAKLAEKKKQQKIIEDLNKEQEAKKEAEKQERVQYLISLYDKGLSKNITQQDIDDLDNMIEDIKKIDKTKADNINLFMCNEIGNFNACFRTLEYYMANDNRKKADEIYNKNWSVVNTKPITIKDKVWIGMNVIILKGVTIGEGAVIGAGSVVTQDVPAWSVVAGNPAKVVKRISK